MIKKYWKYIVLFIVAFVITFVYDFFIVRLGMDEVWCYGFAYNISKGLVPYRDFNMIITPLYSFAGSLFIKIFGNHLFSVHIFNALFIALFVTVGYKVLNKKIFILWLLSLSILYPCYNTFCVLIFCFFLFIYNKKFKHKDFVLGLIIACLFLSKQTLGILIIPLLFFSKDRIKCLIGFLFPCLIFLIYLIYFNTFYQFIDYCILGMFDFSSKNSFINSSIYFTCFFEIIVIIIILYKLIKGNFKNQKLIFVLAFQIMAFPLLDYQHVFYAFIPVVCYILMNYNLNKISFYLFGILCVFYLIISFYIGTNSPYFHLYSKKNSFLYGRSIIGIIDKQIDKLYSYLDKNRDDNRLYIFSCYAYLIRLNNGEITDKYDLINNGNMGYKGEEKYIKEIDNYCSQNKCMFVLISEDLAGKNQTSKKLLDYVQRNYDNVTNFEAFGIYTNNLKR